MMSRQIKGVIFSIMLVVTLPGFCMAQEEMISENPVSDPQLFEGFVFFTDTRRVSLKSETVRFASRLDAHQLGREIIHTLIQGPTESGLKALWSKTVQLNAFFIADDGKAYVDLDIPPQMLQNMDTRSELLTLYSMVNSLTLNIPKIKMVKLLIRGKDAKTLAGHLDMEYFYKTNMMIVK